MSFKYPDLFVNKYDDRTFVQKIAELKTPTSPGIIYGSPVSPLPLQSKRPPPLQKPKTPLTPLTPVVVKCPVCRRWPSGFENRVFSVLDRFRSRNPLLYRIMTYGCAIAVIGLISPFIISGLAVVGGILVL